MPEVGSLLRLFPPQRRGPLVDILTMDEGHQRLSPRYPNPWTNPFMLTDSFLPPILLAFMVETLLYGTHVVLFCICVQVLRKRIRRSRMQRMMFAAVMAMFLLATADIGVSWNILLRHTKILYQANSDKFLKAVYPKFLLFLVANFIADILLIIRCYVVWERKKIILFGCGGLLLVGTVFGCISEGTTSPSLKKYIIVYVISVLVVNVGVTSLTAGRIIWIAKEVKAIMGPNMASQYHFATGVLIESGVIYTAATILVLSLSPTNFILMAATITIRVVAIVPTLLIVQIALGQSTKNVSATVSMIQVGGRQQVILDTVMSNYLESDRFGRTTHNHSIVNVNREEPESMPAGVV